MQHGFALFAELKIVGRGIDITCDREERFNAGMLKLAESDEDVQLESLGGHLILHHKRMYYGHYNKRTDTLSFTSGSSWPNVCSYHLGMLSEEMLLCGRG